METFKSNVRVVVATNRDLLTMIRQGEFRDGLYFPLVVVRLTIPPFSERRQEIPFLTDHFIQRFDRRRGKRIQGVTPAGPSCPEIGFICPDPGRLYGSGYPHLTFQN